MAWTEVLLVFLAVSARADDNTEIYYEDYTEPPLPEINYEDYTEPPLPEINYEDYTEPPLSKIYYDDYTEPPLTEINYEDYTEPPLPEINYEDYTEPPLSEIYYNDNTEPPLTEINYEDYTEPPLPEINYEDYTEPPLPEINYDDFTEPPPPDISEAENDTYVVVGDMFIAESHYRVIFKKHNQRKGLLLKQMLWPKERGYPTVPYNISLNDEKGSKTIQKAMKHWEDRTCIRFRPATDKDKAYVKFINGRTCSSAVGRTSPYAPQTLKLGRGCRETGTIIHELGHAIGFTHEMMRSDRNDYLILMKDNILKRHLKNFMMVSDKLYSGYGVPFDYASIMLYNTRSFTSNGGLTLKTKDPMAQGLPGSFQVLSHRDALLANKMYDCIEEWTQSCGLDEDYCKNEGYISRDCICICPPGTKGYQCEEIVGGYYDELMPKCNRKITKGGTTIRSPKYPRFEVDGTACVYHIIAPKDYTIEIVFDFFDIFEYRRVRCKLAAMIFMEDKINRTTIACGKYFSSEKSYKSSTNEVIMFFHILQYVQISRGFKCRVEFHPSTTTRPTTSSTTTTTTTTTTTKTSATTSTASTTVESTSTTMKTTTKSTTEPTTTTTTMTPKITAEPTTTKPIKTTVELTTSTPNSVRTTTPMPATTTMATSITTPTSTVTITNPTTSTKPKITSQPTTEIGKTSPSSADSVSSKPLHLHLAFLFFFLFVLLQFDFPFQW